LPLVRLRFVFRLREVLPHAVFQGSLWRGAFGYALKSVPMLPTARSASVTSWQVSWDQLGQACGLDQFLPKVKKERTL